jgi:ParB family chromosome partitioning protein
MKMRLVPLNEIVVQERQRKKITEESVQDLMASISQNRHIFVETRGLIQPIILRGGNILVAGERRLSAHRFLGRSTIAALDIEDMSEDDAAIIELEENVKRSDLSWQERCHAAADIHRRLEAKNEGWNQSNTAERLGVTTQSISRYLALSEAIRKDPFLAEAASLSTAFATLQRQQDRKFDDMLTNIQESVQLETRNGAAGTVASVSVEAPGGGDSSLGTPPPPFQLPPVLPGRESLLNGDFFEWSRSYSGPKFNFIHCDFPYGAGATDKDSQINAGGEHQTYNDTPEIFWSLCQALLDGCSNVIAPSAHIMLWFQTENLSATKAYFDQYAKLLDLKCFGIPLIWHKSDNSGVVSDPARRARHIYETAFVLSRGDRKIVRTVSDVYSCPISRSIHPAEKPQPMLEHFFQMFVSNTTRMLDPTAGSGTSLRAAEALGADFVFGLERDEKFHSEAILELDRFRRKKQLNQLLIKEGLNEQPKTDPEVEHLGTVRQDATGAR